MLLKDNITGNKACYKTIFKSKIKRDQIYFYFKAYNSTFNSYSNKNNDKLYDADVCEVFIKNDDLNHYFEIEVAPNGALFFANVENNNGKTTLEMIDDFYFESSVKISKKFYKVIIKFPLNKLNTKSIKFNAFRIDTDSEKPNKHLFALNPTLCKSFHVLDYIK